MSLFCKVTVWVLRVLIVVIGLWFGYFCVVWGFPVTRGFCYCLWVALRSSWEILVSAYLFVLGSFWVGCGNLVIRCVLALAVTGGF